MPPRLTTANIQRKTQSGLPILVRCHFSLPHCRLNQTIRFVVATPSLVIFLSHRFVSYLPGSFRLTFRITSLLINRWWARQPGGRTRHCFLHTTHCDVDALRHTLLFVGLDFSAYNIRHVMYDGACAQIFRCLVRVASTKEFPSRRSGADGLPALFSHKEEISGCQKKSECYVAISPVTGAHWMGPMIRSNP